MIITVCGSSSFAKEKIIIKEELEKLGHKVKIDKLTKKLATGETPEISKQINIEHSDIKKKYNLIKMYYDFIIESDAIIVCNYEKKGISNYIGSNTFLEMGYAYVHGKKIFLHNEIPDQSYILDEVKAMEPVILKGNLNQI